MNPVSPKALVTHRSIMKDWATPYVSMQEHVHILLVTGAHFPGPGRQSTTLQFPPNLPHKEVNVLQYWVLRGSPTIAPVSYLNWKYKLLLCKPMQVRSFWMISSGASPILSSLWVWDYNHKTKLRNLTFPRPWDNAAPTVHTFHKRINACVCAQGISATLLSCDFCSQFSSN